MARIILALLIAAAATGSALAWDSSSPKLVKVGPVQPSNSSRMQAHHHPGHCTIRHHHLICRK